VFGDVECFMYITPVYNQLHSVFKELADKRSACSASLVLYPLGFYFSTKVLKGLKRVNDFSRSRQIFYSLLILLFLDCLLMCGREDCLKPFVKSPSIATNNNTRLASGVV